MHILITGASGFIGQELAVALLKKDSSAELTLTDIFEPPKASGTASEQVATLKLDLTSAEEVNSLLYTKIRCYLPAPWHHAWWLRSRSVSRS